MQGVSGASGAADGIVHKRFSLKLLMGEALEVDGGNGGCGFGWNWEGQLHLSFADGHVGWDLLR